MNTRIVLKKTSRKPKPNVFGDIFRDCPPENPRQLYVNAAIDAVGDEHGQVINELSEDIAGLLLDVAQTAAFAVLDAARISEDWRDVVKPSKPEREKPRKTRTWQEGVIHSPVHFYREMAWEMQAREHPELLECGRDENEAHDIIGIVDEMIEFALTAASVDGAWDRLYEATQARVQGSKR